jgi:hypothetical protein
MILSKAQAPGHSTVSATTHSTAPCKAKKKTIATKRKRYTVCVVHSAYGWLVYCPQLSRACPGAGLKPLLSRREKSTPKN